MELHIEKKATVSLFGNGGRERVGVVVVAAAAKEQRPLLASFCFRAFFSRLQNSRRAVVDVELYTPTLKLNVLLSEKRGFIATQVSLFSDTPHAAKTSVCDARWEEGKKHLRRSFSLSLSLLNAAL